MTVNELTVERRRYRRFAIWFPLTIRLGDAEVGAISRDASPGGLRVSAAVAIPVGSAVTLQFRLAVEGGDEHVRDGVVVREVWNDEPLSSGFPHQIAIRFDPPAEDLLDALTRHADAVPSSERLQNA